MAFLPDSDARAAEALAKAKRSTAPQLADAVDRLLEDRRSRTALLQRISRELHHVRGRLAQAGRYLEGLLAGVQETARSPWPRKVPCPHCGAPIDLVLSEYRPEDPGRHVQIYAHADGTRCEEPPVDDPRKPVEQPAPPRK